jgi:hypothetical protein
MELADRERKYLMAEIVQAKDLMPLLMKKRNRQPWSAEDRREVRERLTRLSKVSPYLVVFALPGGMVMLPVLSWWLDRRRRAKGPPAGGRRSAQGVGTG